MGGGGGGGGAGVGRLLGVLDGLTDVPATSGRVVCKHKFRISEGHMFHGYQWWS